MDQPDVLELTLLKRENEGNIAHCFCSGQTCSDNLLCSGYEMLHSIFTMHSRIIMMIIIIIGFFKISSERFFVSAVLICFLISFIRTARSNPNNSRVDQGETFALRVKTVISNSSLVIFFLIKQSEFFTRQSINPRYVAINI